MNESIGALDARRVCLPRTPMSSTSDRLLGAAAAVAGIAIAARTISRWRRRNHAAKLAETHIQIELLPSEVSPVIMMTPAITTVTFFRGDLESVKDALAQRVAAVVSANPWLASVLDYDADGNVAAWYPKADSDGKANMPGLIVRDDLEVPYHPATRQDASSSSSSSSPSPSSSSSSPPPGDAYHGLVTALAPAMCKPSVECVGKHDEPLFMVTAVPCGGRTHFALVVSANHSLVDGHGFYTAIYNQLGAACYAGPVKALNPVRKKEVPARMLAAMGGEPSVLTAMTPGFLLYFMLGQVRAALFPQTKNFGFFVDEAWIKAEKAAAIKNKEGAGDAGKNDGDDKDDDFKVTFVSTNDVLLSSVCNTLETDLAISAINFRNRVEDCDDSDAGNYEDLMMYMPADYRTPALIRKSVAGRTIGVDGKKTAGGKKVWTRAARPRTSVPSDWHFLTRGATLGAIANWVSFAKPLTLEGGGGNKGESNSKSITQELHLPLFDWPKTCPACICGSAIWFRPSEGRVAMMVAGKQAFVDKIKASGMVGEELGSWWS